MIMAKEKVNYQEVYDLYIKNQIINMFICLRFCDYFSTFISVNQRFKYDQTATNNRFKKGVVEQGNLLTEPYKL